MNPRPDARDGLLAGVGTTGPGQGHRPRASAAEPFLSMFDPLYGPVIASWVPGEEELAWLAPGTPAPLTAAKIMGWGKGRDYRFLFWSGRHESPSGYAELSFMAQQPDQMWIGHFLIDPRHRRQAYGRQFAAALLDFAFMRHSIAMVLLVVAPDNEAAIRCYEAVGLRRAGHEHKYFEATRREHDFLRMTIDDRRYYELVAGGRLAGRTLPVIAGIPQVTRRGRAVGGA